MIVREDDAVAGARIARRKASRGCTTVIRSRAEGHQYASLRPVLTVKKYIVERFLGRILVKGRC